jgi:hypothetical protein
MTEQLKTALRELADTAPAATEIDVWPAAVRRRQVRAVTLPAVIILVVAAILLGTVSLGGLPKPSIPVAPAGGLQLPKQVYTPWWWQQTQQQSPIGSASVLMTGRAAAYRGVLGDWDDPYAAALVGARSGDYRMMPDALDSVLSPDGGKLAQFRTSNGGLSTLWIVDLRNSHVRAYDTKGIAGAILAWSPDGRTLAFTGMNDGGDAVVAYLDVASGIQTLSTLPVGQESLLGSFSPDGRSFALAYANKVYLQPVHGGRRQILSVPAGYQFAGGWSADGKSLAVAGFATCPSCDPRGPLRTWTISFLDPVTEKLVAGMSYGPLPKLARVTVAGWRGSRLVVLAQHADDTGNATSPSSGIDVVSLARTGKPEVLLSSPPDVATLQVAADAINGSSVEGAYPAVWQAKAWAWWTFGAIVLILLLVISLIGWRRWANFSARSSVQEL